MIVGGDAGPTPGDETAIDIVESLQAGWLVDVAKAVTVLGSATVVLPLALICAVLLGVANRWAEVGVLLAGMAIVIVGVHELKDAIDRPRPGGGLVDTEGSSFPSGHAAYSTFYIWLAVTVVMRLRQGMARGALLVTGGIVLAALIGLSRVYLEVHYLSDVNAGWALGAAAFSLCAAVALVITTVRQNDERDARPDPEPLMLPIALQQVGDEYLLFGIAALISLVAFVGLILVPALSAYGRIWEKAAAGVLSLVVLAALVVTGVIIGLMVVYYYPDIVRLLRGLARPRLRGLDNEPMPAASKGKKTPVKEGDPATLDALAEAVESGAGLPAVARAAAKVLDASVALIDRSSAVLAVAGASSDQEKKLIAGGDEIARVELRVADSVVGELRYRSRSEPNPAIARMVTTLLALELERARSPEWESEEVAGAFVGAVLAREVTDRGDIVARAAEMGADLEHGAGVLIVRAAPRAAQTGEWRARVLTLTLRALRSLASGALATAEEGEAAPRSP